MLPNSRVLSILKSSAGYVQRPHDISKDQTVQKIYVEKLGLDIPQLESEARLCEFKLKRRLVLLS